MDTDADIWGSGEDSEMEAELTSMSAAQIRRRTSLLGTEVKVLQEEASRLEMDRTSLQEKITENMEKIKYNKQLPYLVGNIVEVCVLLSLKYI